MAKKDVINSIIAAVFLIGTVISIPNIFLATFLMGVLNRAAFIGFIFSFSLIGLNIYAVVYMIMSVFKKTVIYNRKGGKIYVKVYTFVAAGANLLVFFMAWVFTGLLWILWLINVIISMISGFVYQPYTEEDGSYRTTTDSD